MDRRRFQLALAGLIAGPGRAATEVAFAPVLPSDKLVFPRDLGAHPDFRTEWWYLTGWLRRGDGSDLGFQLTFFRVRTGLAQDNPSAFAPRQLLLAHGAVSDPKLGRLRHDQRSAREGFGRAGFTVGQTRVWLGDWRLEQSGDAYRAAVHAADFSLELSLRPDGPPVPNGVEGFSAKAADPRHASHYYSRPQLAVRGSVTLSGSLEDVTGLAWLDHEWSSSLLPEGAQGWDWVGLNLQDGSSLMAFRMRGGDGATLWTAATQRSSAGVARTLAREQVAFEPTRWWTSPRSAVRYPVQWTLRIGERRLQLVPLLDDQELDSRRSTGAIYWEGAVRVLQEQLEVGRGYLELTGYGERIRVG